MILWLFIDYIYNIYKLIYNKQWSVKKNIYIFFFLKEINTFIQQENKLIKSDRRDCY